MEWVGMIIRNNIDNPIMSSSRIDIKSYNMFKQ